MLSLTVHDLLRKNVEGRPNALAVVDGDSRYTYGALDVEVEALAGWLYAAGVRRGDRVCIQLNKSVSEVVATFAVARIGGVFVNVHAQRTLSQLAFVVADSGSRVALVESRRAHEIARAGAFASLERVLVRGKAPDEARCEAWTIAVPAAPRAPAVDVLDPDLAALMYTSGSTGSPKGVMFTHLNLVHGARSVARYLQNTPDDKLLAVLPVGFDYGLSQLTTAFLAGASVVLQPVSLPVEIVRTVIDHEVTGLAAVPPIWTPLVRLLRDQDQVLTSVRYVTNSGGALPRDVLDALPRVFPRADIVLMYGLTEAFRSTYVPPAHFERKKGAIGIAIPGVEVFVINPEGGICGPNEQGELVHRGTLVTRGYWQRPIETAAKIRVCPALSHIIGDEKVCFSGDRVRIDGDGYLWFVSRMDELIKCNGVRISPTEVEEVLHATALVGEAVAFGVDDETAGQVVHAVVSAREGAELDVTAVLALCRARLPTYMVPRALHCWSGVMPRNANGKLDRHALISRFRPGRPSEE